MKGINKSMSAKRLKRGISAMMKVERFLLERGDTSGATTANKIIKDQSKLIKKIKGVY
tara:strand:- start:576 stop:749 length:174 start_codon:yes stop_codon:yes gene_type:complete